VPGQLRLASDRPGEIETRAARHLHVEQRNGWPVLEQELPGLVSVSRFNHRVLVGSDGGIHQQAQALLIVCDEHRFVLYGQLRLDHSRIPLPTS
jgi:hypothetical protein